MGARAQDERRFHAQVEGYLKQNPLPSPPLPPFPSPSPPLPLPLPLHHLPPPCPSPLTPPTARAAPTRISTLACTQKSILWLPASSQGSTADELAGVIFACHAALQAGELQRRTLTAGRHPAPALAHRLPPLCPLHQAPRPYRPQHQPLPHGGRLPHLPQLLRCLLLPPLLCRCRKRRRRRLCSTTCWEGSTQVGARRVEVMVVAVEVGRRLIVQLAGACSVRLRARARTAHAFPPSLPPSHSLPCPLFTLFTRFPSAHQTCVPRTVQARAQGPGTHALSASILLDSPFDLGGLALQLTIRQLPSPVSGTPARQNSRRFPQSHSPFAFPSHPCNVLLRRHRARARTRAPWHADALQDQSPGLRNEHDVHEHQRKRLGTIGRAHGGGAPAGAIPVSCYPPHSLPVLHKPIFSRHLVAACS